MKINSKILKFPLFYVASFYFRKFEYLNNVFLKQTNKQKNDFFSNVRKNII